MKLKYLSIDKQRRKEIRKEYFNSNFGKKIKHYLSLTLITSILCFIYSIYLIYDAFFKHISTINKTYSITVLVSSIILIIAYIRVRLIKLNDYVIKKKYK